MVFFSPPSTMSISFQYAPSGSIILFVIFLAGLHSELTTQAQVTRLRTNRKMDNKTAHATPRKPPDQFWARVPATHGL